MISVIDSTPAEGNWTQRTPGEAARALARPPTYADQANQGLGVIGQAHDRSATSLDTFDGKGGGIWRDGHPRWRHIGTLPSYGSGTAISPVTTPLQSRDWP